LHDVLNPFVKDKSGGEDDIMDDNIVQQVRRLRRHQFSFQNFYKEFNQFNMFLDFRFYFPSE